MEALPAPSILLFSSKNVSTSNTAILEKVDGARGVRGRGGLGSDYAMYITILLMQIRKNQLTNFELAFLTNTNYHFSRTN